MNTQQTLDVRTLAPRESHSKIFNLFDMLLPGQAFELVNDHDPKPLYYQFSAERGGRSGWDYLQHDPEVWRVQISKTG